VTWIIGGGPSRRPDDRHQLLRATWAVDLDTAGPARRRGARARRRRARALATGGARRRPPG